MSDADVLSRHPVPRHRLTVSEFHRLGEVGILGEDDRVELLQGQLVDMSPIGPRHALAVDALTELLITAVAGRAAVRVQNPLALDDGSQPRPDVTLARRPWNGYPGAHPGPADVWLLIEVADTSLPTDSGAKLELYARAGICEVWIIDLVADVVRIYRAPVGAAYMVADVLQPSAILTVEALPGVTIPASPLFA